MSKGGEQGKELPSNESYKISYLDYSVEHSLEIKSDIPSIFVGAIITINDANSEKTTDSDTKYYSIKQIDESTYKVNIK